MFEKKEWWEDEWQDMPEFIHEDQTPYSSLMVHFSSDEDMRDFSELIGQRILRTTKSVWYPDAEVKVTRGKYYTIDRYNKDGKKRPRK